MKRENTKSISELLPDFIEGNHLDEGLQRVHVFDAWESVIRDMAAPSMSALQAGALTSRKFFRDGVLTCTMASSIVRTQLRFQLEPIRRKVNILLGEETVKKIIIA